MAFNENTRVKIPAILHLCRLGYKYVSLTNAKIDESTNIFTDIFSESILRINPEIEPDEIKRTFEKVSLVLDNVDLGQEFYKMLTASSGIKLIDYNNFSNNSFHVVTELTYKNGDDEFRPDITLLINGMPLAFIEVKKPNNRDGILAERDRINVRFKNKKFKKFINLSQILVYSNNMEYDTESIVPIQGAFYSSTSSKEANFNCFREENPEIFSILNPEDETTENFVLKDNNLTSIKHSPEFITNKSVETPTNKIITSLFSKDRFAMFLKYSIAYVQTELSLEKHIMRYPQYFATKAIENKLNEGIRKGIIWHTQGSGKTALAFYNVPYLTDYFQKKGIIPKFYFIVDRLDLLEQAKREFTSRGLTVHIVNSKKDLLKDFHDKRAIYNLQGKVEITVVNIQRFVDDSDVLKEKDYNISVQRIYFLDEVHRSYNPQGSFLANLFSSDREAILIGLSGTPLIGRNRKSKDTFGDYIHKYYYNASIADGYTLKLIREGIETSYKMLLKNILSEIDILKGDADREVVYSHKKFVEPMLDYIIMDFVKSRIRFGDDSIGAMVVCDSSSQAKRLFEIFNKKYAAKSDDIALPLAADRAVHYPDFFKDNPVTLSSALILHDTDDTTIRKENIEKFKAGKIDILFVYAMLLTGFDSSRLKKLYVARLIRRHNLLQTLTRVNRPYKDFRYGFVVDFADIREEFKATNQAYFDELQMDQNELDTYSNLFKSKEEIVKEIEDIMEKLSHYNLQNAEIFSQQISEISDRKKVLEIKKSLENARNIYNVIRLVGHYELLEHVDFKKLNELYIEASHHLDLLNLKESVQNNVDTANLLNVALENVLFMFRKISENELIIADQLKDMLRKTREALGNNFDKLDPEFIKLLDEMKRVFQKKNLEEISQDEMKENIGTLQDIFDKVTELNRKNNLLRAKYENDEKYARVHKRIIEKKSVSNRESMIIESLAEIKKQADEKVLINENILNNDGYFANLMMGLVINSFESHQIALQPESAKFINNCVVKEYLNESQGVSQW